MALKLFKDQPTIAFGALGVVLAVLSLVFCLCRGGSTEEAADPIADAKKTDAVTEDDVARKDVDEAADSAAAEGKTSPASEAQSSPASDEHKSSPAPAAEPVEAVPEKKKGERKKAEKAAPQAEEVANVSAEANEEQPTEGSRTLRSRSSKSKRA